MGYLDALTRLPPDHTARVYYRRNFCEINDRIASNLETDVIRYNTHRTGRRRYRNRNIPAL